MRKVFITGGSGFVGQNLIKMLLEKNYDVVALARSEKAIKTVEKLGATGVRGDLQSNEALKYGMKGCDSVFHLAAEVDFYKSEKELHALNVTSTALLLKEAQNAGIGSFIYLSAASVVMNGKPIHRVDETFVSNKVMDGYSRTKLKAEQMVLAANIATFRTIALRPSLIWGKGESHVLPTIINAVQKGQLKFINGGDHEFITCHVTNVCHALILAENSSKGGETYFIMDEKPFVFRDFIKRYLATQNVSAPNDTISLNLAKIVAGSMELIWKVFKLKGTPPLTKATVYATGIEFTATDSKAKREIAYDPIITVAKGFEDMTIANN